LRCLPDDAAQPASFNRQLDGEAFGHGQSIIEPRVGGRVAAAVL
jgi:hypothetical protein